MVIALSQLGIFIHMDDREGLPLMVNANSWSIGERHMAFQQQVETGGE
jgi:hypothetical protein